MTESKVYEVQDIDILAPEDKPPHNIITASGTVTTSGWTNAELIPHAQQPSDGIYEYDFVAQPPPPDAVVLTVITPVTANYRLEPKPNNFRGFRIHASRNTKEIVLE